MKKFLATFAVGAMLAMPASAAVTRVTEANFNAAAGLITFSEPGFSINDTNPTYTPGDYGGGAGSPTVNFDGFFVGQSISANPGVDCPGAAASACVIGAPTGPLTLDANAPDTFITTDGATPTSPVLSGSPRFNGPIAVLFDTDQFGVGFTAGFFDAVGSTAITAYARDGSLLGSVVNIGTGVEFLGLVSANADIAGVELNLVGSEPAGFVIDNLRFGVRGQVNVVPLPAAGWLLLAGVGGLVAMKRRSRATA
jgi:hypothetical protein